jgi:hypothetical protein
LRRKNGRGLAANNPNFSRLSRETTSSIRPEKMKIF